ncbi:hypothetical protein [Streptomyces sp. NPDC050535]|uniref:hypothetical protein n=1 Tax=Streptomyces sp. NPDC050535 TaxID=3365626 RepID=UPI0037B023CE
MAGLIGVIVGALVMGYFGPLKLWKRNAELEKATARRRGADEEVQRLVDLRFTVRQWHSALQDIAQELQLGRSVELERFEQVVHGRREAVAAAVDACIPDGMFIGQQTSHVETHIGQQTSHVDTQSGRYSQFDPEGRLLLVLDVLEDATRLTRGLVIKGSALHEADRTALDSADRNISRVRDRLATLILDHVSAITGRPVRLV